MLIFLILNILVKFWVSTAPQHVGLFIRFSSLFKKQFCFMELSFIEFAKSRTKGTYMPMWSRCQRACVPPWFTCQGAVYVPMCQKSANFSFLRANVPIIMPACHTSRQFFNLACQLPYGAPIFQHSLDEMLNKNLHYAWYISYTYMYMMYRT